MQLGETCAAGWSGPLLQTFIKRLRRLSRRSRQSRSHKTLDNRPAELLDGHFTGLTQLSKEVIHPCTKTRLWFAKSAATNSFFTAGEQEFYAERGFQNEAPALQGLP